MVAVPYRCTSSEVTFCFTVHHSSTTETMWTVGWIDWALSLCPPYYSQQLSNPPEAIIRGFNPNPLNLKPFKDRSTVRQTMCWLLVYDVRSAVDWQPTEPLSFLSDLNTYTSCLYTFCHVLTYLYRNPLLIGLPSVFCWLVSDLKGKDRSSVLKLPPHCMVNTHRQTTFHTHTDKSPQWPDICTMKPHREKTAAPLCHIPHGI